MILDLQTQFSGTVAADGTKSAQAITATAISTNQIDLQAVTGPAGGPTFRDIGIVGQDVYLMVQTVQAFNNLTSLTITLESAADSGLTSSPVVHFSTGAILLAALTANTTLVRIPMPLTDYRRFLGLRYTVAGTAPTQGSLLAYLTLDVQRNLTYPIGYTVDV